MNISSLHGERGVLRVEHAQADEACEHWPGASVKLEKWDKPFLVIFGWAVPATESTRVIVRVTQTQTTQSVYVLTELKLISQGGRGNKG